MEQVLALLARAEDEAHPLWAFLHLVVYTSMRRGEALALLWSHLDRRTVFVLNRHREVQMRLAAERGMSLPEEVFPGWDLSGLRHPNSVYSAVRRLAARAGCPQITMRSLRHFHATLTLQAKQNPVVVSKRLGHSSPTITLGTYAHVLDGWQQEAAEAFADAMDAGS